VQKLERGPELVQVKREEALKLPKISIHDSVPFEKLDGHLLIE
jgi:hypothetical protein